MAGVLVHIEAHGLEPTESSLRVLGEGRRIATTLGATLYVHLQIPEIPGDEVDLEELAEVLGRAGADRAIVTRAPEWKGPPLWSTHGPALAQACSEVRPLLVLLAGGATGAELGPRLAASMSAAFLSEPDAEHGARGELVFSRPVFGSHRRRLSADDLKHPLVVTLPARGFAPESGSDGAYLRVAQRPKLVVDDKDSKTSNDGEAPNKDAASAESIAYKGARADAGAALEDARIVVIAGSGVTSFETYSLVESLADALGGAIAATQPLCAKGIAPPEREVGIGARRVSPDLVVICGAADSNVSLGAITGAPDIVAIDSDPDAQIFRVADYGLVGELDLVLPDLISEIANRPAKVDPR